jgi:hypothetical protein
MARLSIQSEGIDIAPRELNWGVTRIGRGAENDLVIHHPSISYNHCELELGLDFVLVRDCGSTNGTFINDEKIKEARLDAGQILRLGQVVVNLEISRHQVSVPKVEAPKLPESVPLGDGVLSCLKHPTIPAVWHCSKCGKFYCTACTRDVHLVGRPSRKLCPACSVAVELAPWADAKPVKKSIWGRIKKSFSRTARVR